MKASYVESLANCYGLHRRCGSGNRSVLSVRQGGQRRPAIELRNLNFRVPTWSLYGEGHIDAFVIGENTSDTAESENLCMRGNLNRENREIRSVTGGACSDFSAGSEPFSGEGCHER